MHARQRDSVDPEQREAWHVWKTSQTERVVGEKLESFTERRPMC